jgi:hypothetical protein
MSFIFFFNRCRLYTPGRNFIFGMGQNGLGGWICGTCLNCHSCPSCEPHVDISPICEYREYLNNCNCDYISHEHLDFYGQ